MKKELFIPVLILTLTLAFAVVSAIVFINGGRSAGLIKRKMRLGALLLTFNAMVWGAKATDDGRTCYIVGPPTDPSHYRLNIKNNLGYGLSAGTYTKYYLGDENKTNHSLRLDVNYSYVNMNKEVQVSNSDLYLTPYSDGSNKPYPLTGRSERQLSTIDLRVMYNYTFFGNFSIAAGPGIKCVISDNLVEQVIIDEADRGKTDFRYDLKSLGFKQDKYTTTLFDGRPKDSRDFVLGFNAELNYEFLTDSGMDFLPYIGVNRTLDDIFSGNKDYFVTIYGGLAVRFKFLY